MPHHTHLRPGESRFRFPCSTPGRGGWYKVRAGCGLGRAGQLFAISPVEMTKETVDGKVVSLG